MAPVTQISIVVLAACLAFQAFPLASQGLLVSALAFFDSGTGTTAYQDAYRPYFSFVLSTSAISCLFYLYL